MPWGPDACLALPRDVSRRDPEAATAFRQEPTRGRGIAPGAFPHTHGTGTKGFRVGSGPAASSRTGRDPAALAESCAVIEPRTASGGVQYVLPFLSTADTKKTTDGRDIVPRTTQVRGACAGGVRRRERVFLRAPALTTGAMPCARGQARAGAGWRGTPPCPCLGAADRGAGVVARPEKINRRSAAGIQAWECSAGVSPSGMPPCPRLGAAGRGAGVAERPEGINRRSAAGKALNPSPAQMRTPG